MNLARAIPGLLFCIFFVGSCFTNKYVLSVLKFTYPTLFQGWQTCTGALLLWVTGKLGWVEIKGFPRSAAVSWLPGSVLFLGNIYGGSRALSILPIPFFFVLQNVSEVVFSLLVRFTQKERSSWMKTFSENLMLMSAITLALQNRQFGLNGYVWAVIHFCCVGLYKVFQRNSKSSHLSILLLATAAHPTGDLFGALDFPFRRSYKFYSGCFASAILGFFLALASVKLKSGLSLVHCAVWLFLAKILASGLSIFIFSTEIGPVTLCCILTNHVGEALSIHANRLLES
ncbi:transmembrane protein 241 isoform X2 [Pangasianodon hypophthalmus]|uniref:transmembrane protein 241 isoform X2 n=1 Tax=Pangasianodon hypophthalmus TaxID=310915 RepID=UPI000F001943|nr:transmembrane protein 241 isoform X2 [Pangasianodon hypophthalmus]